MKILLRLAAVPLGAGLMLAQSTGTPPQTQTQTPRPSTASAESDQIGLDQTFVGILVSSECNEATMPRTSARTPQDRVRPSDMDRGTPTDRAMAEADRSRDITRGTPTDRAADMNRDRPREINQTAGGSDTQLDRTRTMDQTQVSADRRGTPTDTQAANNPQSTPQDMRMKTGELSDTANWDRACFISTRTESFSFQMPDGRVLKVDGAGNQQIKAMLDSTNRVSSKNKIFRAKLTGSVDGDTLHVTNIVM